MEIETQCLYAGYSPKNGEPQTLPICQSTTFKYESTEQVSKLFDLEEAGFFYTRLGNPTVDAVEQKIATLEGGVGALCTASGQAATTFSILTLAAAGDHIVSSSAIYGGSLNLFAVTLKRLGIEVTFVSPEASEDEIQAAFRPNTKALFGETIANPSIEVLDIEKFARIAHRNGVPLIVDNTFATPVLCRPIEFGADIVVHSTTKYMDGHALQMGGVIVDGGKFDWTQNDKFPGISKPNPNYHGAVFAEVCGNLAYIVKIRATLLRDTGATISPFNSFLLLQGLETLSLRVERHVQNALRVADYLSSHPQVEKVNHPSLPDHPNHDLYKRYYPNGGGSIFTFEIKGGAEKARKFCESLELFSLLANVADVKSLVIHPAYTTHSQMTEEELKAGGITPSTVRLSIGTEHIDDILEDLEQGFRAIL